MPVLAQGPDCTQANPIAGVGSWPVDMNGMTDSGFDPGPACFPLIDAGYYSLPIDGFWQWTANAAGDFLVTVDAPDSVRGKVRVHRGQGCAVTCAGWDWVLETNGYPHGVHLENVQAGEIFLVEVLGWEENPLVGTLRVRATQHPCLGATDDAFEPNDDFASAKVLAPGSYQSLFVSQTDRDVYRTLIPPRHSFSFYTQPSIGSPVGLMNYMTYSASGALIEAEVFGVHYANAATVPVWFYYEPVVGFASADYCAEYDATALLERDDCARPDDFFGEAGHCDTPAAVTDSYYADLFQDNFTARNYSFCLYPGAQFQAQIDFDQNLGDFSLELLHIADGSNPCFQSQLVQSSQGTAGMQSVSWTATGSTIESFLLRVSPQNGNCTPYDLTISGTGHCGSSIPIGQVLCAPATANSTGFAAQFTAFGNPTAIAAGFEVEVENLPPNSASLVIGGRGQAIVSVPLALSPLCLGGSPANRYFDTLRNTGGDFRQPIFTRAPNASGIPVSAGESWRFQLWYRDGGTAPLSNFSNAVEINF